MLCDGEKIKKCHNCGNVQLYGASLKPVPLGLIVSLLDNW